jgi:glucose/arabinose dehydrogenase
MDTGSGSHGLQGNFAASGSGTTGAPSASSCAGNVTRRRSMRNTLPLILAVAAVALGSGCRDGAPMEPQPPGPPDPPALPALALRLVADGLAAPLHLTAPPADPRLFVVEQPGRIRIIRGDSLLARPFLDITARVQSGGERGLLSMAFPPDHAATGYFWVNYTDLTGATTIERYRVSAEADVADPGSASLVLRVDQPYANHNGGLIAFGPDGMLYIGMGDGGSGGDPQGHGQRLDTLLGALLRIDVRGAQPYTVPADNPLRGTAGARPEIWAYGLRNPWRFSFDAVAGYLYLADVGQNRREEINAVPVAAAGLNYGWNRMEGSLCYPQAPCDVTGLTLPVHEYGHDGGCSVAGGFVYRGDRIPGLRGHYLFSDYCRGWIRGFRLVAGQATDLRHWHDGAGTLLSLGQDAAGELYLLTAIGRVYRIEPS